MIVIHTDEERMIANIVRGVLNLTVDNEHQHKNRIEGLKGAMS